MEVEEALDNLRTVATGVYPDVLDHAGIAAALRSVARRAATPISIEDDGVGFELRTVERGASLANMTDRATAAGGTLRIERAGRRGTRVSGQVPA
jgi:signal transduction histidine kinase